MITFALLVFLASITILAIVSTAGKAIPLKVRVSAVRIAHKLIDIAGIAVMIKLFVYCTDNFW